jgi:hypothetical protein
MIKRSLVAIRAIHEFAVLAPVTTLGEGVELSFGALGAFYVCRVVHLHLCLINYCIALLLLVSCLQTQPDSTHFLVLLTAIITLDCFLLVTLEHILPKTIFAFPFLTLCTSHHSFLLNLLLLLLLRLLLWGVTL